MTARQVRAALYRAARLLGDVEAARNPRRIPARIVNKTLGRRVVSRLWR